MDVDPFKLQRFVDAQAGVYPAVCAELARGRKTSHWMWFVFPQLAALGRSGTAKFYGLADAAHARAYWMDGTLGARLRECSELVLSTQGRSAHDIFGSPDDLKLCSCMTLFEAVVPEAPVFADVLDRFYRGSRDVQTLELLRRAP
ncbi:MAG: DUF1810 domain-containing protein [Comamonadaceae bacterium]|nr:MAG: DUF1810 domain-containing protein [Comamonadaceae bacterium]